MTKSIEDIGLTVKEVRKVIENGMQICKSEEEPKNSDKGAEHVMRVFFNEKTAMILDKINNAEQLKA